LKISHLKRPFSVSRRAGIRLQNLSSPRGRRVGDEVKNKMKFYYNSNNCNSPFSHREGPGMRSCAE